MGGRFGAPRTVKLNNGFCRGRGVWGDLNLLDTQDSSGVIEAYLLPGQFVVLIVMFVQILLPSTELISINLTKERL